MAAVVSAMKFTISLLAQTAAVLPWAVGWCSWRTGALPDMDLRAELRRLGGHGRIRIKGTFWVYGRGLRSKVGAIPWRRARRAFGIMCISPPRYGRTRRGARSVVCCH